jgi:hypothetical protein
MGLWDRLRGKPTRDDFAALFIAQLRKLGDDREVRYDANEFKLVCGGDGGHQLVFLENAYGEYLAAPRSRRGASLARFVRAGLAGRPGGEPSRDEVLARLLPRVRARIYYESLPLQMDLAGHAAPSFAWRPLAEHMAVGLVQDFPDHLEEMPAERFAALDIDIDTAFEVARDNLERISESDLVTVAPGLFASPWRDNHDASRLVLTERLRRLPVRGLPVVSTPNRDHLLVAGSDDPVALEAMAAITRSLMDQPRFDTSIPLCLVDDDYRPFVPERGHPLHALYAELRVMQLADEYAQQKRLLERQHERDGVDVFVASFTGLSPEGDAAAFSYCVWTKDVATLLPRAEQIALFDPDDHGEPVMAPWEVVAEIAGELMEPLDVYPPRYRVEVFPDRAALAAVRARRGE